MRVRLFNEAGGATPEGKRIVNEFTLWLDEFIKGCPNADLIDLEHVLNNTIAMRLGFVKINEQLARLQEVNGAKEEKP